jgi:hypothetical protein
MTIKPPLQMILQGIMHTEDENKQNHERMKYQITGEEKTRNQRVTLIWLHMIKSLNNKNS